MSAVPDSVTSVRNWCRVGDSLNLTCESGLSSPPPVLEWLVEGRRLLDGVRTLETIFPLQESRSSFEEYLERVVARRPYCYSKSPNISPRIGFGSTVLYI
jgi:hypothetical protein